MYLPCCPVPNCLGKQGELAGNCLPNLTVRFILSLSTYQVDLWHEVEEGPGGGARVVGEELAGARQDVEGGVHAEDPLGGPELTTALTPRLHEAGKDGEEVVEEVHVDGVAVRRYAPGRRGCDY